MMIDNKSCKFINYLTDNFKRYTSIDNISIYLPINNNYYSISIIDNIMIFKYKNKISRLYSEKNCFSNIEILKRIGCIFNITLESEDIISITKFITKIKLIMKKEGYIYE